MSDYYDAWSASKRKKGLGKNVSSSRSRLLRQYQPHQQHQLPTSAASNTTASLTQVPESINTTASSIPNIPFSSTQHSFHAGQSVSFSPSLPRHPTTTSISLKATSLETATSKTAITAIKSIASPRSKSLSTWRFSRGIFDSSLRASTHDGASPHTMDEDDISNCLSHVHIVPRTQGSSSKIAASTPVTPNFKNLLKWTASPTPRLPIIQVQQSKQEEHSLTIEQLDIPDERASTVYSPYMSLARSSPALSGEAIFPPSDHPQSATTFSAGMYPQPILEHLTHFADQSQTTNPIAINNKKLQSRRPRPWSQVIWESPLPGESSHTQQQYHQLYQSQPRIRGHSINAGSRTDAGYPALRKDMFTPTFIPADKEKEKATSKSVRINIDDDVASDPTIGLTSYPIASALIANENTIGLTPKREISYGRRPINRISLGSGFYASIEPVSLSNATPSTPRTKRLLVRLPARPQSVFIPSTAHHFSGPGSVNPNGNGAQNNGTRMSAGLQPISTDQFKRRRHKSQQLEMKGDRVRTIPIPWQQLAPMSVQDNAKTFHGIGSTPAPIPILKKGSSQEDTLGSTALYSLNETPKSAQLPSLKSRKPGIFTKPNAPYMQKQHSSQSQGQGLTRFNPSPPTSASTLLSSSTSSHQRNTSSRTSFLPALFESSSSFLFKKAAPSSIISSSSPISSPSKRAAFGSQKSNPTCSPRPVVTDQNISFVSSEGSSSSLPSLQDPVKHGHYHQQQQQQDGLPSQPIRQNFSNNSSCNDSPSSTKSSSSNYGSHGTGSLFKKSRRKLTASWTPFPSNISESNAINLRQQQRISALAYSTVDSSNNNSSNNSSINNGNRTSLWKRNSSSVFFPFSLVSYESGGLLGEIKNTSTTICTNAPSPIVAPGTPLPPGAIVSTGIPPPKDTSSTTSAIATPTVNPGIMVPTISITTRHLPSSSSPRLQRSLGSTMTAGNRASKSIGSDLESRNGTPTRRSRLGLEVFHGHGENRAKEGASAVATNVIQDGDDNHEHSGRDSNHSNNDDDSNDDKSYDDKDGDEEKKEDEEEDEVEEDDDEDLYADTSLDGSIVIQKSHVAVYEINARWESRLMMFLVTIGGIICTLSGGLCAEHHCGHLQLCPEDYQAHGNWCGPSGMFLVTQTYV
ncbi:hypothetical protein FBU30_000812 [Linnemannia zychae]|nr:hypothetical protein FBU30_000812 [Linnemannia zychae]